MGYLDQFTKQIEKDNKKIETLSKKCLEMEAQITSMESKPESPGMMFSEQDYKNIYNQVLQIKKNMLSEQKEYAQLKESNSALSKKNERLLYNIEILKKSIADKKALTDSMVPKQKPDIGTEDTAQATKKSEKVDEKQEAGASSVTEIFSLPDLPWERNALQPNISEETINFHYGKHHAGYVKKLNIALGKEDAKSLKGLTLEDLIKKAPQGKLWNCAAQHWNHSFYWNSMSPNGGGKPTGAIAKKIDEDFGDFEKFKAAFTAAAAGLFGSGWAWLLLKDDKLVIAQTCDAKCPISSSDQGKPILTCDVWEHAYYVDYRNDRGKYISNWWNLVNWDFANKNMVITITKDNKDGKKKVGKKKVGKKKDGKKKDGKKKDGKKKDGKKKDGKKKDGKKKVGKKGKAKKNKSNK